MKIKLFRRFKLLLSSLISSKNRSKRDLVNDGETVEYDDFDDDTYLTYTPMVGEAVDDDTQYMDVQGGGSPVDITFEETVDTIWNIIKNDSYIHLLHSNIRSLELQQLGLQNYIVESQANVTSDIILLKEALQTTTTATTTTQMPPTTTAVYTEANSFANKKINFLLNMLKQLQTENPYNLDLNLSVPKASGDGQFLYTANKELNDEVNAIMLQLNAFKLAYNLNKTIFQKFFENELKFYHWDTRNIFPSSRFKDLKVEAKMAQSEALLSPECCNNNMNPMYTAVVASFITTLIILIPYSVFYVCSRK